MGCFKSSPKKVETKAELPGYIKEASESVIGGAQSAASDPYQQYGGQRVAGFNPDQNNMFDMIRGMQPGTDYAGAAESAQGAYSTPYQQYNAGNLLDSRQGGDLASYMNPYTGSVIEQAMRGIDENQAREALKIHGQATGQSGFGDARHGVQMGELERNTSNLRASTMAQLMDQAFKEAVGMKGADMGREQQAFGQNVQSMEQGLGRQIAGYGGEQGRGLQMAGALGQSGDQQQMLNQLGLDVGYQDFLTEQGWDKQQIEFLASIIGSQPAPIDTMQTTKGGQPSTMASILGTAAGVGSLMV